MPTKIRMMNGAKRKSAKRRNPTTATKAAAMRTVNGAKRKRSRRNGTEMTAIPRNSTTALAVRNGAKRRTRKRKNGISIMKNGIFGNLTNTLKTVGLGAAGAVGTGIAGRATMSIFGGQISRLGVPNFVAQAAVEGAVAGVAVPFIGKKAGLSEQNTTLLMTGGLIKAGLTLADGFMPDLVNFNPIQRGGKVLQSADTDFLEGTYDEDEEFVEEMDEDYISDY